MSIFDLTPAILQLATHVITVTRFNTDTYDTNGYAQARTSTSFTANASVQPISGKDLSRLPDGVGGSEYISIWADKSLALRDRVTVPGRGAFEVEHLDQWNDSGAYTKVIARALDETEPRS